MHDKLNKLIEKYGCESLIEHLKGKFSKEYKLAIQILKTWFR